MEAGGIEPPSEAEIADTLSDLESPVAHLPRLPRPVSVPSDLELPADLERNWNARLTPVATL